MSKNLATTGVDFIKLPDVEILKLEFPAFADNPRVLGLLARIKLEIRTREEKITELRLSIQDTEIRSSEVNEKSQREQDLRSINKQIDRISKYLEAMYAALDRGKIGTFGICINCQEDILENRLDTQPHTPFCFECADILGPKKPK